MTTKTKRLVAAVEQYFTELRMIRASGGGTDERSNYVPLANLLNAVGGTLKPKVFSVLELADQGAGHPDLGLYAAHQVRRGKPRPGQRPERGVVEVKSPKDDTLATIVSDQVGKYQASYGSAHTGATSLLPSGPTSRVGCYQVLKKWLSYREKKVLGRPILPEEVQHFTDSARRIAAILRLKTS